MPFAAPRSNFHRERLADKEEEEEEDKNEDGDGDEDEEDEYEDEGTETTDSDDQDDEDALAGISEREESSSAEKGVECDKSDDPVKGGGSVLDNLGLEKMTVDNDSAVEAKRVHVVDQDKGSTEDIASGDIHMASPPPPEGSSRVTGGVLRGRALGNVLSFPDAQDILASNPVIYTPPHIPVRLTRLRKFWKFQPESSESSPPLNTWRLLVAIHTQTSQSSQLI